MHTQQGGSSLLSEPKGLPEGLGFNPVPFQHRQMKRITVQTTEVREVVQDPGLSDSNRHLSSLRAAIDLQYLTWAGARCLSHTTPHISLTSIRKPRGFRTHFSD